MRKSAAHIHLSRDLQTGRLIQADRAERRPGRLYFRHFRGGSSKGCTFAQRQNSRSRHAAAQNLLCTVLREALARRTAMPYLQFMTPHGIRTAIPLIIAQTVKTEWTCPNTGRRADIAVLDANGEPVVLIEVFHSHAVDGNKRKDLGCYWWIEIGADEFLKKPEVLNVLASGNLPYAFEILGHQADLFECQM